MTGASFASGRRAVTAALLLCCIAALAADRSKTVRADFMRANPCPSTGLTRGACPGHQVDHRTPLCAGGKDERANLQWLSVEAHKAKTRGDVRLCRAHP